MRLADFILAEREPILAEWEAFARTCAPASGPMDVAALRDHAEQMLTVIAADLGASQSRHAQAEKARGRAPTEDPDATTAAGEHGAGRAQSGFTVGQMVAEYRALRASVIRLWTSAEGALDAAHVEDLTRFNEAIDQALAESVTRFNQDVEQAKETFLAILGHDLRTPLGAIQTSATFMLETGELEEPHRTLAGRIAGSARRSVAMIGDLLDFTRSRLGGGIPLARTDLDLGRVVRTVSCETPLLPDGRRPPLLRQSVSHYPVSESASRTGGRARRVRRSLRQPLLCPAPRFSRTRPTRQAPRQRHARRSGVGRPCTPTAAGDERPPAEVSKVSPGSAACRP